VNSCVHKKHIFFEGAQQQQKSPGNPRNTLSDAPLLPGFPKFAAGAATKNHSLRQVFVPEKTSFLNRTSRGLINYTGGTQNKRHIS